MWQELNWSCDRTRECLRLVCKRMTSDLTGESSVSQRTLTALQQPRLVSPPRNLLRLQRRLHPDTRDPTETWRPLISTDSVKSCLCEIFSWRNTWICLSRDPTETWRPLISTDSVKSCLCEIFSWRNTWICLSRDLQRHEVLSSAPTRLNHVSVRSSPEETPGSVYLEIYRDMKTSHQHRLG